MVRRVELTHAGMAVHAPLQSTPVAGSQVLLRDRSSGYLLLAASTHRKAKEGASNEAVRKAQVRRI